MTNYPTAWQRRVLWIVITSLAIVALGTVVAILLVLFGRAVGFLQPVLIPLAVAALIAFLLDPVVRLISARTRLSRTASVLIVFVLITLLFALLLVSVIPQIYAQTVHMAEEMPAYTQKAQKRLISLVDASEKKIDQLDRMLPGIKSIAANASHASASPSPAPSPKTAAATGGTESAQANEQGAAIVRDYLQKQLPALGQQVPAILDSGWGLFIKSLGGFMGVFGALLSALIIPVYVYFLLVESHNIARRWSEYLPIRDSPFKQEVISVLIEINGYLAAFFRGQLLVSTIDGILIGGGLFVFVQLDFSFFIGLLVVVLTFIPYLGIILCYVPAVLIAVIQYGDWQHPLYVVAVMFVVQTLESTIISPKIVGDSVGLHPLTVIISVLGWSLLLDGPIGAILAVPLSATCKVLLRRYVWEKADRGRRLVPLTMATARSLDETAERTRLAREREAAQPPAELLTPVAATPASPAPIPAPPAPAAEAP